MDEVRKAELIGQNYWTWLRSNLRLGYPLIKTAISSSDHKPGHVDLLAIPAGFAINTSVGLMNPFGIDGYKVVMPSEDDPKDKQYLG